MLRLIAFGGRSLLLLVLMALWEAIPRLGLADPTFLPPFSDVIAAGWQLAQKSGSSTMTSRQACCAR